jgi:hypothetical protein
MPWTAKQLKLFRAAAHNPAISKSSGIKQADAERMSKEGLKKMAGGGKAVINKQDTKHGKMDMPFNKLNRFAGMKAGGMMKKGRRYDEGGDVDEGIKSYGEPQKSVKTEEGPQKRQSFAEAFKDARTSGDSTFTWNGKKYSTEMAKPAAKPVAKLAADVPKRSISDVSKNTSDFFRRDISNWNRFAKGGMTKGVEKKLPTSKQMGALGMKSGGMKESKAMVGKEVDFMKKMGAPKSMVKHEAAEMGAMKKGGMAKYMTFSKTGKPAGMKPVSKMARGGGIESKGKTKGTIIKMAAGGLAGGHKAADGIAQRGKTKGMKVSMKGGGYC